MTNTPTIRQAIAEGLASWLEFERHCSRDRLFSERYLALPIAQILAAQKAGVVEAEHNHPVLSALGRRGRPPQLDFAIRTDSVITLVVETKWLATRRMAAAEVVWDCVRLEIAAHHYNCDALFVLAGEHGRVKDVLESAEFNPNNSRNRPSILLGYNGRGRSSVNIESPKKAFGPDLHRILSTYPSVPYPRSFVCGSGIQYPRDATRNRFSVTVWQIRPEYGHRWTFRATRPANGV